MATGNAVIVLDGASQPDPGEHDGGWLAEHLGIATQKRLIATPGAELAPLLADAIREVATAYALSDETAPTTTISIVRWSETNLDVLVLCDSPVVVFARDGQHRVIEDDRLAAVTERWSLQFGHAESGLSFSDRQQWRSLVTEQRARRNRPGGYWVAGAVPDAAYHAVTMRFRVSDVAAVLAMTDGVAVGVTEYGVPADWNSALASAEIHPGNLVDAVHTAEDTDPDGTRWPRGKRHDDKAVALIRFVDPLEP